MLHNWAAVKLFTSLVAGRSVPADISLVQHLPSLGLAVGKQSLSLQSTGLGQDVPCHTDLELPSP